MARKPEFTYRGCRVVVTGGGISWTAAAYDGETKIGEQANIVERRLATAAGMKMVDAHVSKSE